MNAFVTSGEYDGVLLKNNTVSADSLTCGRTYILRSSEVIIVDYPHLHVPKNLVQNR